MPAGKCTIDWDGFDLLVRFDYDEEVVNDFKSAFWPKERTWDRNEKAWRLATTLLSDITVFFEEIGFAVRDFTGTDAKSIERQKEHRARRAERESDFYADLKRDAQERQRKAEEQAAREERARKAREAEGDPFRWSDDDFLRYNPNDAKYTHDFWRHAYEGKWPDADPEFDARLEEHDRLRFEFKRVWPEYGRDESVWTIWWNYYLVSGRDEANRRFSAWHNEQVRKRQQRERAERAYDEFFRHYFHSSASKSIDHYAVLGIVSTSTYEEAKKAYRQAALKAHPDKQGGSNEEMTKVNVAWQTICEQKGWRA